MQPFDANKATRFHQELVDYLLQQKHIVSPAVADAFRAVPRHLFLPDFPLEEVYRDQAITTKIVDGQFVSSSSQPTMMAIMLEQLQLEPGQRVLEIGAGTGYNAALMAHIVGETGQVVTVDIDADIVESARANLLHAGYERVQVLCTDGAFGYADAAPYDRIILTVQTGDIAPAWRKQLAPGGRLLLPLSLRGPQVSVAFVHEHDHLTSISLKSCGFVGLRGTLAEPHLFYQLGPRKGIFALQLGEPAMIETQKIYDWLLHPYQDVKTPIIASGQDIFYGISFWLALHDPGFCTLFAYGAQASQSAIPALITLPVPSPTQSTIGVLGEHAISVLLRDPAASKFVPSALFIRTFGPDETLAERMQELLLTWETAGRPDERRLSIKAYPIENVNNFSERCCVVSKRATQFVCRWHDASS